MLRRRVEFAQFAESGTGAATRRLALLGLAATLGRDIAEAVPATRTKPSGWTA